MELNFVSDYSGFVANMLEDLRGYLQAWGLYLAFLFFFLRR